MYDKESQLQATYIVNSCYYYCTDNKLAAVQSLLDGEEDDDAGGWDDDEEFNIDEGMFELIVSIHT